MKIIIEVTPLKGKHLPKKFREAVDLLTRPYILITEDEYNGIYKITSRPATDIVMLRGEMYTFGGADCGYALMPLNDEGKKYIDVQK